jgi:hypothetical protein
MKNRQVSYDEKLEILKYKRAKADQEYRKEFQRFMKNKINISSFIKTMDRLNEMDWRFCFQETSRFLYETCDAAEKEKYRYIEMDIFQKFKKGGKYE